ncbi:MAG: hypothetical protein KJ626_12455 [Verrucomicrobia bacterium]|nr:hypothetical protein [Verrucomicrobiota bacterium]
MSYNCIVIVREVWDTRDLTGSVLADNGSIKDSMLTRFEPEDMNALEMALRIKDEHGGKVTAFSVGTPKQVDVLRECLYRGVDEVVRVDAGASSLGTQAAAQLLADAIGKAGQYDLICVGVTVADGESSMLGTHVAGKLGIEQVSYVDAIEEIGEGRVVGKRGIEMGYEYIEAPLPALLSVGVALVEDDPRTPRSAKAMLKLKAKKAEIPSADVDASAVTSPVSIAGREAVPERAVESKDVAAEDETALKSMLDDVLKGE